MRLVNYKPVRYSFPVDNAVQQDPSEVAYLASLCFDPGCTLVQECPTAPESGAEQHNETIRAPSAITNYTVRNFKHRLNVL